MNAIEMKDDTSRGVWRSIFLPPRGGGCPKGRRGGGLGLFQPCFTLNRRPLSCPCRGTLSHKGRGKANACSCFTMTNIFMRLH
ncbi:hypothetical protein FACS1894158_12050 [Betaproteobacteria bacterium]|nr:hypothetical protein FACS1894158_12050 [Betaproteobacteria bacterium]